MDADALQALRVIASNFTNVLVALIGFFLVRTLKQLDTALKELKKDHKTLEAEQVEHGRAIARLEGFQDGVKVGRGQLIERRANA